MQLVSVLDQKKLLILGVEVSLFGLPKFIQIKPQHSKADFKYAH
jgi:hypothetical protein